MRSAFAVVGDTIAFSGSSPEAGAWAVELWHVDADGRNGRLANDVAPGRAGPRRRAVRRSVGLATGVASGHP